MRRLEGALDSDVHIIVGRLVSEGVSADIGSLYTAIQRSNSSLKRKPKKVLQQSLDRVLDFINAQDNAADSDAAIEELIAPETTIVTDIMNRSLRANLAPPPDTNGVDESEAPKKRRMANGEPLPKRQKAEKLSMAPPVDVTLHDLGGIKDIIKQLKELLVRPLLFPETYAEMAVPLPKGILLHGPPGCGKTMISRAFAGAMGLPFIEILGPSIVSGMSGESERGLRERFEEAKRNAPCMIFLDEIDAIAPKRDSSQSQMEKRIVAQLLVSMDELNRDSSQPVIVLATTNRPDSIDPALRRGGRFDTEINIPVPNEKTRARILQAQSRKARLASDVNFEVLAKMTAGFVGSDLGDLVGKAGSWQLNLYFEALEAQAGLTTSNSDTNSNGPMEIEAATASTISTEEQEDIAEANGVMQLIARAKRHDLPQPAGYATKEITMAAFLAVLPLIIPSSKREGFATIPDVSWSDIGALKSVREELHTAIIAPIKNPGMYAAVGISAPTGILLWGPPGCGKTLLAKAVAAESKANFISIKGPELLNKFVGESEAAVRRVFTRARSSVPCVIFFDELDALVPRRDGEGGSEASARVVNTLLTELDGLSERGGIYVIAATNRPDIIDEAMLRPGRLETPLFVDLPGANERVEILRALLRNKPVDDAAGIANFAGTAACEGYSGADLGALLRQAGHCALRRGAMSEQAIRLGLPDFVLAGKSVKGSVRDMGRYYKLRERFAQRF